LPKKKEPVKITSNPKTVKVEVNVSGEDIKILKQNTNIADVGEFLSSFLHETCQAVAQAMFLEKSGIKITKEEIEQLGREIAKKAIEDGRKAGE